MIAPDWSSEEYCTNHALATIATTWRASGVKVVTKCEWMLYMYIVRPQTFRLYEFLTLNGVVSVASTTKYCLGAAPCVTLARLIPTSFVDELAIFHCLVVIISPFRHTALFLSISLDVKRGSRPVSTRGRVS